MAKTDAELLAQFNQIANETLAGANTKTRVSDALKEAVNARRSKTGTFVNPLVFDTYSETIYISQTSNITLALASSGNVEDSYKTLIVDSNPLYTFSAPSTFPGVEKLAAFNVNTKRHRIYLHYQYGEVTIGAVQVSDIPSLDSIAPIVTFNPLNGSSGFSPTGNITISLNETGYTTAGVILSNSNIASVVTLKQTNSSGAVVPAAITITGNTITINPTSDLSGSQSYYVEVAPIRDAAGNQSETQSATFTTGVIDNTAPSFTTNNVSAITTTAGTYNAQINEAGTVKWLLSLSATVPSKGAILAGTGAVGSNFGSLTMVANTANTAALTGLTANTTYYLYAYAIDSSTNESAIQTTVTFSTAPTVSTVTGWTNLVSATESPSGTLNLTTANTSGGQFTIDNTVANWEIFYNNNNLNGTAIAIDDENSNSYNYTGVGTNAYLARSYFFGGEGVNLGTVDNVSHAFQGLPAGQFFKYKKSNNDLLFQSCATEFGTYTTHYTWVGILAGKTTLHIKAFISTGSSRSIIFKKA